MTPRPASVADWLGDDDENNDNGYEGEGEEQAGEDHCEQPAAEERPLAAGERPLAAEEIVAIRKREHVSQAVFALYLNVSTGTVSQWERGKKEPVGPSLKLLTLVQEKGLEAIA